VSVVHDRYPDPGSFRAALTQCLRQLAESSRSELKPVGATSLLSERFGIPDVDRWSQHYPIEARKVRRLTLQMLTDAITLVGNFVDPILAGTATGSLVPVTLRWRRRV
jgi:hypothetical protein